jgi:hypothetical protein
MDHRIDISPARRKDAHGNRVGYNRYFVYYRGERLDEFRSPLCETSRWLLNHGRAAESDTITAYRDGSPALSGTVGAMAKLTVAETDKSGPRFAKWFPFAGVGDGLLAEAT